MAARHEYEKVYTASIVFAALILSVNLYYYCHPLLARMGVTFGSIDYLMLMLRRGGVFSSPVNTKLPVIALMGLCAFVRSGKGTKVNPAVTAATGLSGLVLYFLPCRVPGWYLLTTLPGLTLLLWTLAVLGRMVTGIQEHSNDLKESFPQEKEPVRNDWSINLPTKYYYRKAWHDGWISVCNPFRGTLIVGSAGAGKSFSVFNPYIEQMIGHGYTMMLYDYKMPDLTKVVYNALERNHDKYSRLPQFYCINFKDPLRSNRCNPLAPEYLTDIIDASETARVIMEALNKGNEKKDFFWMSATQYIGICIWHLRTYTPPGGRQGDWCDFPHLIELINQDYTKVLEIVKTRRDLDGKARVFIDALEANAQDQLQGQIASARIPLNDIASPALYWVLSGNDFNLDINDPEDPKILCIGNDPDRQQVYGAALSLFTFRVIKRINRPGRLPCAMVMDELPTISVQGLDGLMATARSNKVAVVLGIQDLSQIVADYGDKTAEKIISLPANVFVGASSVKTAEKYSKEFGREFRRQESQTRSVDSESISISYHEEEVMPIRKITTMPQGTFIGKVAVDNKVPIEQPFFCGAIQIDMDEYARKKASEKDLPILTDFGLDDLWDTVCEPGISSTYIMAELEKEVRAEWRRKAVGGYTEDELAAEVERRFSTLSDDDCMKMLRKIFPQVQADEISRVIEENYDRIKGDIRQLIDLEWKGPSEESTVEEMVDQHATGRTQPSSARPDDLGRVLSTGVENLELSSHVRTTLLANGIGTLGELASLAKASVSALPRIGGESMDEIRSCLESHGLSFGMDLTAYGYRPQVPESN